MNAPARSFPLPLHSMIRLLRGAVLALAAAPAGAAWDASGEVDMRYRTEVGGTLFGRTAATISETLDTDIIVSLEVGGKGSS